MMTVSGRVCRGSGSASAYLSRSWVRRTFACAFGFVPFPETFTVDLGNPLDGLEEAVGKVSKVLISPEAGSDRYALLRAFLEKGDCGVPAVLIRPLDAEEPPRQLEFAAPVDVRDALGLDDGDEVTAYLFTSLVPCQRIITENQA